LQQTSSESADERIAGDRANGEPAMAAQCRAPLCVDLDGTLVRTDTLIELVAKMVKRNPFYLFLLPLWLLKGKAYFKTQVAGRESLQVDLLPFQQDLVAFLKEQYDTGRQIIMVTGANEEVARQVAAYLRCFDEVMASNVTVNLSGLEKHDRLVARFGMHGFDYVGNEFADLGCLQAAQHALVARPLWRLQKSIARSGLPIARVFDHSSISLRTFLEAIRVKQWVKNFLIIVPLILAHKLGDWHRLASVAAALVTFCLFASSAYLLNDLLDLEADRRHPIKRARPLASGDLPILAGVYAVLVFLILAALTALLLPGPFALYLLAYFICTVSYSLYLKRLVLIDVLTLAGLYTVRILAGGAAADVEISQWLAAFSMFFFLSLALLKRYSELQRSVVENRLIPKGRGYTTRDVQQIGAFGSASGYVAALVMALYINRPEVTRLYSNPQWLWLMCVLVIYWISRAWLLADRGEMNEDPILFALTDKVSYAVGAGAAVILLLAL
jgi:4-hydroxybenzoate polyprenyltransferase/phosphoserine phosphatase